MNANRGAKVVLSWLNGSRAQRIVWLMEELNMSYELKTYKRDTNNRSPPELKDIHPLGKSPIVTISFPNVAKPRVLAESAAIMEYLVESFDGKRLIPQKYQDGEAKSGFETESWIRYRYLMHYGEGSLFPLLAVDAVREAIKKAPVPFFVKPATNLISNKMRNDYLGEEFALHLKFLENQLATAPDAGQFMCGSHLTTADILLSFPIQILFKVAAAKQDYPLLAVYIDRLEATDTYKRSIKKVEDVEGEPYMLVPQA